MGKVTSKASRAAGPAWRDDRAAVVAWIVEHNENVTLQTATLYADAFCEYRAAVRNIAEHGSIVLHPRTGAPVDNPYLKVRDKARKALEGLGGREWGRVRVVDGLWDGAGE